MLGNREEPTPDAGARSGLVGPDARVTARVDRGRARVSSPELVVQGLEQVAGAGDREDVVGAHTYRRMVVGFE